MSVQDFIDATKGDCFVNVIFIGHKNRVVPILYADAKEARDAKIETRDELRSDGIRAKVKTFTLQEAYDSGYNVKSLIGA